MSKRWSARLAGGFVAMSTAVALAACGTPGASSPGAPAASEGGGTAGGAPYKVGLVYSKTGALAAYGAQYQASFKVGLDYATKGTNAVNGRPIEVTEADDAGDPAKAVTAATDPHRHGRQDHRRLDRLGRRAAGRAAGRGEQGAVHLRAGRHRRRDRGEQVHLPLGTPDVPGHRHGRDHGRRPARQEGHRLRAGQRVRQGQRGRRHGGLRRQGGDRRLGAGARRPPPTSRRSPSRPRARHRICCSLPGPAPTRPRCGPRWPSRASSPRPRWSPASTSSPPTRCSARSATRSRSSRTSSTVPPTTRRDQALVAGLQEGRPGRRPVHRRRLRRGADGRAGR